AKRVTPDGLAISLGSEFIENTDPKATQQDCELKAFRRLAERLKRDYPSELEVGDGGCVRRCCVVLRCGHC
ncbi:MAG: hypothetical protein NTU53_14165, partial [Planctomycetota bacterium]|nr:hypothetical protein [Planctomycetota bacterium]